MGVMASGTPVNRKSVIRYFWSTTVDRKGKGSVIDEPPGTGTRNNGSQHVNRSHLPLWGGGWIHGLVLGFLPSAV